MPIQIDGINVHIDNSHANLAQRLGCSWVRIDIDWWLIEKSAGKFSWSQVDSIVNAYRSRGLKIYATLMGSPSWHKPDFNIPPNINIWKRFCIEFAKRYVGKVDIMSLWNEPNLGKRFWKGSKKEFFEIIVKGGYEAIKSVNPNIVVAAADFATTSSSNWASWLSMMKKYKNYIDVLAIHTYHDSADEVKRCWNYGKIPYIGWFLPKWQPYKWYINDIKKPVYLTETGYEAKYGNSKQMAKQKEYVEDLMKIKKDIKVQLVFFYCLLDAAPNAEEPWGFYSIDGKPKLVSQ